MGLNAGSKSITQVYTVGCSGSVAKAGSGRDFECAGSTRWREFVEDRYKPVPGVAIHAQFVVAASGPLH